MVKQSGSQKRPQSDNQSGSRKKKKIKREHKKICYCTPDCGKKLTKQTRRLHYKKLGGAKPSRASSSAVSTGSEDHTLSLVTISSESSKSLPSQPSPIMLPTPQETSPFPEDRYDRSEGDQEISDPGLDSSLQDDAHANDSEDETLGSVGNKGQ